MNVKLERLEDLIDPSARPGQRRSTLTFIGDDGSEERVTSEELFVKASALAARLGEDGVAPGDRLIIAIPTSVEFATAFFGSILAGAVPCPTASPSALAPVAEFAGRLAGLAGYLGTDRLLVNEKLQEQIAAVAPDAPVRTVAVDAAAPSGVVPSPARRRSVSDVALIQCTSGSTGTPRGAVLTHANLLANTHQIGLAVQVREGDAGVTWLPMYHDMGLTGCFLSSLYWGMDLTLMNPGKFLRDPIAWLSAISRTGATLTASPNFGYAYTTARARDAQLAGIRLDSLRVALCGAEPINIETVRAFEARFAGCGLRRNVVTPAFGLAEASLAVTVHRPGDEVRTRRAEAAADVDFAFEAKREAVSCGVVVEGAEVRIAASDGRALAEGTVGRVLVRSPSVMKGYFELKEETDRVLVDGWLDTGDLGFMHAGELFVVGRRKDILIIRGRCLAPSEFEWAAEEVPGVRKGRVVALGLPSVEGTEALHLVCEMAKGEVGGDDLPERVRAHVAARTGVHAKAVHLTPPGTLPITTSGKVQRARVKAFLLEALASSESEDARVAA
jgi:acyl-CoA synthetase (AMP-forming)/AMP-acid ligase II